MDKKSLKVSRKKLLKPVRRVVVKVGSGVLTTKDGLNRRVIADLSDDICALRKKRMEVILVSSKNSKKIKILSWPVNSSLNFLFILSKINYPI